MLGRRPRTVQPDCGRRAARRDECAGELDAGDASETVRGRPTLRRLSATANRWKIVDEIAG
jgi:hypothetical protein